MTSNKCVPPTADDFVLLKPISRGAFGKVWLGFKKTNPEKMFAVKVMKKVDLINKNLIAQVTAERDAQARSRSPFVVQLYYSIQSQLNIFLIMEYMIGGDVKSLLIMCGYFSEEMSCMYAGEVTLALEYLHKRGIVHRDLKPDNMLISDQGHIKLTDFGLSKISLDCGSPTVDYMTPFKYKQSCQTDLRTPGQILSLTSSLYFTNSACKSRFPHERDKPDLVEEATTSCLSPLPPHPPTPLDKGNRQTLIRRMLTPAKQSSHAGRLHSSLVSTPPVKSLTPTLQDSLTWQSSSEGDLSLSHKVCSLVQKTIMIRNNLENTNENDKSAKASACGGGMSASFEEEMHCDESPLPNAQHHDPLSCDSHVMPLLRVEGADDDTPLLHRTHGAVWRSYSACSLKGMRDEELNVNRPPPSDGKDSVCTTDQMKLDEVFTSDLSVQGVPINGEQDSPYPYLEGQSGIHPTGNTNVNTDSGFELCRGLVSTSEDSRNQILSWGKSRLISMASSVEMNLTKEFNSRLQSKDQFLNSTRLSLDFGPSGGQLSLDSGPEVKELSHVNGLGRLPLKPVACERWYDALPHYNVVPSKRTQQFLSSSTQGSAPVRRKLSRPGLRRVLSDTFEKCYQAQLNSPKNALGLKSKSDNYGKENVAEGYDLKALGFERKRTFDATRHEEVPSTPRHLLPIPTGLSPDLGKLCMEDEDVEGRPQKKHRMEGHLPIHNLFRPDIEDGGGPNPSDSRTNAAGTVDSSHQFYPQHPQITFLKQMDGSLHSGLTVEVSALALKDTVSSFQAKSSNLNPDGSDYHIGAHDRHKAAGPLRNCSEEVPDTYEHLPSIRCSSPIISDGPAGTSSDFHNQDHYFPSFRLSPSRDGDKPLLFKKGISTLDNTIGTDVSNPNLTIEFEDPTQNNSPLPGAKQGRSRSSSASSLSDIGAVDPPFPSESLANTHPSPPYRDSPGGGTRSGSLSPEDCPTRKKLISKDLKSLRLLPHHEPLPSIAEATLTRDPEDSGTFAKPLNVNEDVKPLGAEQHQQHASPSGKHRQMAALLATPNPLMMDSMFKTPMKTPGGRMQTPMRTPKSVRRGAEVPADEARILGTPDYLAPEILLQKPHGFAVDWWALGVCLYEFLTGLPPFNDETHEAVFQNILNRYITWPEGEEALSDQARAAVEMLLTSDPDARPAAKEVKAMPFFSSLDWSNLLNMKPPFVPQPDDQTDTCYFEPKNSVRGIVLSAVDL